MAVNGLSFDVEEYFHGAAYDHIAPSTWDRLEVRLPANVARLLDILKDRHRATFFFVGWVAERHPDILREIHRRGHEIGCHGHMHRNIWDQSPTEFREDVTRAKKVIEGIIGEPIRGYRAPTFSITAKTTWALDVLAEAGFVYDSSIFPVHHDRYGIPDAPRRPYRLPNGLWEVPLSTARVFGQNVPFGGGGYFRVYPYWLTRALIGLRRREGEGFVFYQHPWELEPGLRLRPNSLRSRIRRTLVVGRPEDKLDRLLNEYRFVPIGSLVESLS